jgi:ankyrin repeat protein
MSDRLIIARDSKSVSPRLKVLHEVSLRCAFPCDAGGCSFELRGPTLASPITVTLGSEGDKGMWVACVREACYEALVGDRMLDESCKDKVSTMNTEVMGVHIESGSSTFFGAALLGDCGAIQRLCDRDQGVTQLIEADPLGLTALHLAVFAGQVGAVETLLELGADVDAQDCMGMAPLHLAAVYDRAAIVPLLVADGADVQRADNSRHAPVFTALVYRSRAAFMTLCALPSVRKGFNQRDRAGRTPLMVACMNKDSEGVLALLNAGANPMATSTDDLARTALHFAVEAGDADSARYLVEVGGAQINYKDNMGETPLHLALTLSLAEYLIGRGARADIPNRAGLPANFFLADPLHSGNPAHVQNRVATCRRAWLEAKDSGLPVSPLHTRDPEAWVNDEASPQCMVCADSFTLFRRRHHCRACGILVCGDCSSKLFRVPRAFATSAAAGAPPGAPERVCDGCFNRLMYVSWKVMPTERGDVFVGRDAAAAPAAAAPSPVASPTATAASARGGESPTAAAASGAKANASASEARRQLGERGEKLGSLAEKTHQMNLQAINFAEMCKKVAEQEKKKGW